MKVKDATIFPTNQALQDDGVFKQHIIPMENSFPPGSDRSTVDYNFVKELGKRTRELGNIQPIANNEYIPSSPPTIVWHLDDIDTQPTAITKWMEYFTAFQDGYQHYGRLGMFGGHAPWMDWAQFKFQNRSAAEIQAKFDYAMQWEKNLQPLTKLVDVCYPMVYGYFHEYATGADPAAGAYSRNFTYDQYKTIYNMALEQQHTCLGFMHWKPIEWFFTDNFYGQLYPVTAVPWVFRQMTRLGSDVNMWNHPDYTPGWINSTVQAMIKYNR